ncbi:MAG: hypothetical protein ACJ8FZ_11295 [Bradyrhizobium sp.]
MWAQELSARGTRKLYSVLDVESAISLLADVPLANPCLEAMSIQGPIGLGGAPAVEDSNDPKAARLRELEQSVAAFNAEKGWTKPAK